MGSLVVVIWIVCIIAIRMGGRSARKRNRNSEMTPPRSRSAGWSFSREKEERTAGSASSRRPGNDRPYPAKSRKPEKDSWYNKAEVTAGDISFRDLPPGTDEMEVLIRHNRRYEKMLEARLESSEDRS